jgi:hypothetical protein
MLRHEILFADFSRICPCDAEDEFYLDLPIPRISPPQRNLLPTNGCHIYLFRPRNLLTAQDSVAASAFSRS